MGGNVSFQPAEMSNEELESMLESLDNENESQGAQSLVNNHELTPESDGKSAENLGARPKEFPNAHSRNFHSIFDTNFNFYTVLMMQRKTMCLHTS